MIVFVVHFCRVRVHSIQELLGQLLQIPFDGRKGNPFLLPELQSAKLWESLCAKDEHRTQLLLATERLPTQHLRLYRQQAVDPQANSGQGECRNENNFP